MTSSTCADSVVNRWRTRVRRESVSTCWGFALTAVILHTHKGHLVTRRLRSLTSDPEKLAFNSIEIRSSVLVKRVGVLVQVGNHDERNKYFCSGLSDNAIVCYKCGPDAHGAEAICRYAKVSA